MARRPVKKRKQRKTKAAKPKVKVTTEESAVFAIPKPPEAHSYQWAPADDLTRMQDRGWIAVPFQRHADDLAKRFNKDGYIVVWGQMLFQREAMLVKMSLDESKRQALAMIDQHPCSMHRTGNTFPIVSPSFMVSWEYKAPPEDAKPILVSIPLNFVVPVSWQHAAAALNLSPDEYARRRLLMDAPILIGEHQRSGEYCYVPTDLKKGM